RHGARAGGRPLLVRQRRGQELGIALRGQVLLAHALRRGVCAQQAAGAHDRASRPLARRITVTVSTRPRLRSSYSREWIERTGTPNFTAASAMVSSSSGLASKKR